MEDPRDDVQFQILEHLRALRVELHALNQRIERLETGLASGTTRAAKPRVAAATFAKTSDPVET